jgi:hypothetical protein
MTRSFEVLRELTTTREESLNVISCDQPLQKLYQLLVILIFPLPRPIKLIHHLFPTRQHLQRPTLIIMIPRLGHQKMRRNRTREHKSAHDLQHQAKVIFLAVVLICGVPRGFEGVGKEDLDEPGAEFSRGRSDAVACASVAGGEYFGGDLVGVEI